MNGPVDTAATDSLSLMAADRWIDQLMINDYELGGAHCTPLLVDIILNTVRTHTRNYSLMVQE